MSDTALFADIEKRTIRGLVLPYGELSSPSVSNTEPVMFSAGTVELPPDPGVVTLNEGHSQFETRGRAVALEDTAEGIVAEFAVARTPEGDALLADASNPDKSKRPKLSAEIRGLVRDGAKALKARLTGAAVVPQGAFASAALFAALDFAEPEQVQTLTAEPIDLEGIIRDAVAAALAAQTPEAAPVAADPAEGVAPEDDQKEDTMTAEAAAVVPEGLTPPASAKNDTTTADGLFAALAYAGRTGDKSQLAEFQTGDALFAISTVQHSGPTTLTIGADVQVPQFVNELWTRRAYQRKYVPLAQAQALTSMKVNGWKWDPAAEPKVAAYSGNTAEIPSGVVDTIPVTADAVRLAGGHRLDRRFIDFGDQSVYQSYLGKMAESYARESDNAWLAAAVAGSTPINSSLATLPTGIVAGLGAIIDGAMAVIASENTPSFAVVNPALWRNIALTGNKDVLGYLDASLGLEAGSLDGFTLIPGAVAANKVLVGAKEAFTFYELPGVPIRVEGIAPHQGAIDPALFGYYATIVNNAAALQLVTCVA